MIRPRLYRVIANVITSDNERETVSAPLPEFFVRAEDAAEAVQRVRSIFKDTRVPMHGAVSLLLPGIGEPDGTLAGVIAAAGDFRAFCINVSQEPS